MITATFNCTIDFWQTYCYNIDLKPSFVEREHVSDDTFGKHIIDEGLPISDYIVGKTNGTVCNYDCLPSVNDYTFLYCVCVSDNEYIFRDTQMSPTNRVPLVYKDPSSQNFQSLTLAFQNLQTASDFINYYVIKNKMNSITNLYMAPIHNNSLRSCYVLGYDRENPSVLEISLQCNYVVPNDLYEIQDVPRISNIDGYSPNNNKCFCYPYNFVNITNNCGKSIIAKYEYSDDVNNIRFEYNFPTQNSASVNGFVKNYCNIANNLDLSITGVVNIELPFITDSYAQYLSATINATNASISNLERSYNANVLSGTVGSITNLVQTYGNADGDGGRLYNMGSQVSSFATQAYTNYVNARNTKDMIDANIRDMYSKGDILHGSFTTSIMQNFNLFGFRCQILQIRKEYIKMIDNYFDMYGYKVNTIKIPQYISRSKWNYVKTNGLNLIGNCPQVAIDTIKTMFDNGTTIWHGLSNMYTYGSSNNIVNTNV